jgi:dTDP-4-dehydrorhamnose 3,5-epimerase
VEFRPTNLPRCLEVLPRVRPDARGRFVKTFHAPSFEAAGLPTLFRETFFSESRRGVLRGMHFQLPPFVQEKLVYCPAGRVLDVLVDLRVGSPTFGRVASFELGADDVRMLFVAAGVAHGFCALSEPAVMAYHVTAPHSPSHDAGIRWDSVGFDWPVREPLVSERDQALPRLADFVSPFRFAEPP